MSKQSFTLYTYKTDKRTKSGERLVSTQIMEDTDKKTMDAIVKVGLSLNPGYRFEYVPTFKTVKNLMTGQDVEIPSDTPWCCNPASEKFWSM